MKDVYDTIRARCIHLFFNTKTTCIHGLVRSRIHLLIKHKHLKRDLLHSNYVFCWYIKLVATISGFAVACKGREASVMISQGVHCRAYSRQRETHCRWHPRLLGAAALLQSRQPPPPCDTRRQMRLQTLVRLIFTLNVSVDIFSQL